MLLPSLSTICIIRIRRPRRILKPVATSRATACPDFDRVHFPEPTRVSSPPVGIWVRGADQPLLASTQNPCSLRLMETVQSPQCPPVEKTCRQTPRNSFSDATAWPLTEIVIHIARRMVAKTFNVELPRMLQRTCRKQPKVALTRPLKLSTDRVLSDHAFGLPAWALQQPRHDPP